MESVPSSPSIPWPAMRHLDYREWAREALGDRRQVYARDIGAAPGSPLVYMEDGAARQLRAAARSGRLVCPVPGCPSPSLTTRATVERRQHFVHLTSPGDPGHDLRYAREATVELLERWVRDQRADYEIVRDATVGGEHVTLLVKSPTGRRVGLVYVERRLGADAWEASYSRLKQLELPTSWVFSLRPSFFALPKPNSAAGPDDPVRLDRERGDLVLDRPIYRRMRAHSCWPLLISLERRELANLIAPRGKVATALSLVAPAVPERVLHLTPSALDGCRLTRYGIATPAVGERVLQFGWQKEPVWTVSDRPLATRVTAPARVDEGLTEAELLQALADAGGRLVVAELRRRVRAVTGARAGELSEVLYWLRTERQVVFSSPLTDAVVVELDRGPAS